MEVRTETPFKEGNFNSAALSEVKRSRYRIVMVVASDSDTTAVCVDMCVWSHAFPNILKHSYAHVFAHVCTIRCQKYCLY